MSPDVLTAGAWVDPVPLSECIAELVEAWALQDEETEG